MNTDDFFISFIDDLIENQNINIFLNSNEHYLLSAYMFLKDNIKISFQSSGDQVNVLITNGKMKSVSVGLDDKKSIFLLDKIIQKINQEELEQRCYPFDLEVSKVKTKVNFVLDELKKIENLSLYVKKACFNIKDGGLNHIVRLENLDITNKTPISFSDMIKIPLIIQIDEIDEVTKKFKHAYLEYKIGAWEFPNYPNLYDYCNISKAKKINEIIKYFKEDNPIFANVLEKKLYDMEFKDVSSGKKMKV